MPAYATALPLFRWISGMVIVYLLAGLCFLGARVFLALWAYRDAQNRGMETPVMWGVLVGLVPLYIGLIVFLALRGSFPPKPRCTVCGNVCGSAAQGAFCPNCGGAVAINARRTKPMLTGFFIAVGAGALLLVVGITLSVFGAMNLVAGGI